MKRFGPILAIVCLLAMSASRADADKPGQPWSYQKVSADGKFVFVMLAPEPFDHIRAESFAIRDRYKESGLYRNDGSDTPLWTVDWYSLSIEIVTDGVHLVRMNTSPYFDRNITSHAPYEGEAFGFFANGKLLRAYRVDEIISYPYLLPHSVSHFQWFERDELDDANLQYKVWTTEGGWFEFDLTTGQIVNSSRVIIPSTISKSGWIVPTFLLLLCVGAWILWRKKLGRSTIVG